MKSLKALKNEFLEISDFLVALGDPKRQAIIVRMLEETSCQGLQVSDLTEVTGLSRPAVSHQLKVLKDAGLVDYKSEGTRNFYYLKHETAQIEKLQKLLNEVLMIMKRYRQ